MGSYAPQPRNKLLSAMPSDVRVRLLDHLEVVTVPAGRLLCEPGVLQLQVYFPIDLIALLLFVNNDGTYADVAVVGDDGMLGVAVCLGGDSSPYQAMVLNSGTAYRLKAAVLRDELARSQSLQDPLLRYVQVLMTECIGEPWNSTLAGSSGLNRAAIGLIADSSQ